VGTLRILDDRVVSDRHDGEIFGCAYTPDGSALLTAGWDGHLRFWNVATGDAIAALKASGKPLSTCGFTPDGKNWLSGSMEGLLGLWNAETRESLINFVAHSRPISSVRYSPDGKLLATTSWDRQVTLRKAGKEREGRTLSGHTDIVAGCLFTPDGKSLLSWSYDGSVRLWDVDTGRELATLGQHEDRVVGAAVSPDGAQAVSASRDGLLKLWDLNDRAELAAAQQAAEPRCVYFLLDAKGIVTVDANGWMAVLAVPSFDMQAELQTGLRPMCGDQAPSGEQFALGCEDGTVHYVALEDHSHAPLFVTPSQTVEETPTLLDRIFGKTRMTTQYHFTCPICRHENHALKLPPQPIACPACRRQLRVNSPSRQLQAK
jgi:hypothetical protein